MPEGSYLASAAGPFTIHPWPPVTKLFLSMTSLTDLPCDMLNVVADQLPSLTLVRLTATPASAVALDAPRPIGQLQSRTVLPAASMHC